MSRHPILVSTLLALAPTAGCGSEDPQANSSVQPTPDATSVDPSVLSPVNPTPSDTDTTNVPSDTTAVPNDTTAVPSDTTDVPSETTAVPSDTTAVPADTTAVPSDTTAVPSDTTDVPSDTTDVPAEPACTITAEATVSEKIQTVGIVTFDTDLAAVDEAYIDFGLDTSYGMRAPVDLSEPNYRTLLLGMKMNRDYFYRITVKSGTQECTTDDLSLATGPLPNFLPTLTVNNIEPSKLYGGFFMTGQYEAMGGANSPAYIIDSDGDYVWALAVGNYVTGVRMSYDGKHMWINGTDNTNGGRANIHRVSMDGLVDEDLSEQFGLQDHSITILPDETVIFYGHDSTQCANIKQRLPDGTIEEIINSGEAHGVPGACHVNAIEYSPDDDTLVFSDDNHDNYTKITRTGEVVWVLGGETSYFSGDGAVWSRQHGVDVLGLDRYLFFNNGRTRTEEGSIAVEVVLDFEQMTATRVWTYGAEPALWNQVLGDVQRLDNGNTVVAFSAQGVVHEVDEQGSLLQEITWPIGGAFGYIVKRKTLYGPPPR